MKRDIVFKLFYRGGDGKYDRVQTEKSCADEECIKGGWKEGRETLFKEINLLKLVGRMPANPALAWPRPGVLSSAPGLAA